MESYELLTGVGNLYVAPVGTAFPALTATPSLPWRDLGETQDGVKVAADQKIEAHGTDQRTGKVKAVRTEEGLTIETKLAVGTLENLADVLGNTVTDTPPGVGTIGTREVPLHRGSAVDEFAFLFRGTSPYGDYPAQYELPRGYFDEAAELEHTKDGVAVIPVKIAALEDLDAAAGSEFGRLVAQDAAALP
jgi:hypothetical protein